MIKVLRSLAIVLAVLIAGCTDSPPSEILGAWYDLEDASELLIFEDGTVQVSGETNAAGNYSFPDDNHIRFDLGGIGVLAGPLIFEYKVVGGNLFLTDSKGKVYEHVRSQAVAKMAVAENKQTKKQQTAPKAEVPTGMADLSKKLEEGYTLSTSARFAIAEFYQTYGQFPNNILQAGLVEKPLRGSTPINMKLVGQLTPEITLYVQENGMIQLSYPRSSLGLDRKFGRFVTQRITPKGSANGSVSWSCSVEGRLFSEYESYLPEGCRNFY